MSVFGQHLRDPRETRLELLANGTALDPNDWASIIGVDVEMDSLASSRFHAHIGRGEHPVRGVRSKVQKRTPPLKLERAREAVFPLLDVPFSITITNVTSA